MVAVRGPRVRAAGRAGVGLAAGLARGDVHIELISGFSLITLGVATRVVFGHSGERDQLERFNAPLTVAAALMLLGLLNRLSGDLVPSTMASHYIYAALGRTRAAKGAEARPGGVACWRFVTDVEGMAPRSLLLPVLPEDGGCKPPARHSWLCVLAALL